MVKSIRYIFTRIIIGVGIAIALMIIKGNLLMQVNAQSIWTADLNLTSMHDMNSQQTYELTITNPIFSGRGRGDLLFNYYMTDYSDFQSTQGSYTTTAMPRYLYVTTSKNYIYVCDIGSLGYQKLSNIFYQSSGGGATSSGANEAMTSVFSVKCPVDLGDNESLSKITAVNVGVQPNTYVQYSRYITFIKDSSNEIKESVDSVDDTLNDDSVDTDKADDDIADMKDKVASNGTITQLLTLPITLYRSILNSLNGTCSSFSLGTLYNHSLTMPCINLQNLLGSTLYNIIDIMCCGAFILVFRKKMVDIFYHSTSFPLSFRLVI